MTKGPYWTIGSSIGSPDEHDDVRVFRRGELEALAVVGEEDELARARRRVARLDAALGDDGQRVVARGQRDTGARRRRAAATSSIVIGVNVRAGPRAPSYSPAMTRTVPPPASATLGILGRRRAAGSRAAPSCPCVGRFTQSCIMCIRPPRRVSSSSWYSSWKIPAPAVIHCTSPGPMTPACPALSRWATAPSQASVTVSKPRCGCQPDAALAAREGREVPGRAVVHQDEGADALGREPGAREVRRDVEAVADPVKGRAAVDALRRCGRGGTRRSQGRIARPMSWSSCPSM